jgi:hypothetical protein
MANTQTLLHHENEVSATYTESPPAIQVPLFSLKPEANISAGIAQSVYRTAGRLRFESRCRQGFSVLHSVQTGSGAHQAFCAIDTGDCFPG